MLAPLLSKLPIGAMKPMVMGLAPLLGIGPQDAERFGKFLELMPEILPAFGEWLERERPDLKRRIEEI